MNEDRMKILESDSVYKSIAKLAIPTVMGMIVQIFYNITDTFFIGKLNDPNQLAAVTLAMPLFMLFMAVSGIIGMGGASYLSRMIGEKNFTMAEKTVNISFYTCIFLGIILTVIGVIFLKPLVMLLGTSAHTYQFTYDFCFILFLFSIIIMLNFSMGQLLRAEGAAKESLIGMLIGTVVNIVLNPVFVLLLGFGVTGSAIATVIGNFVGLIYYLHCYRSKSKESLFTISRNYFSMDKLILAPILMIGIPTSLNQILMSVANVISNNLAASYGDIVVASMGVSFRVFMVALYIIVGIAMGCQPLMGFSYGAANYNRLREVVNKSIFLCTIIGIGFGILFWVFSRQSMLIFSTNQEVVSMGIVILRALVISLPFLGPQLVITTAVQSMGKALPALILSISRQGLFYIPAMFILTKLFGFYGFIYSQAVTDILVMFVAVGIFIYIYIGLQRNVNDASIQTN